MAGDKALMAISTRMRNANVRSCSSVRYGPSTAAVLSFLSSIATAPLYRRKRGSPLATKSPTWGTNSCRLLGGWICLPAKLLMARVWPGRTDNGDSFPIAAIVVIFVVWFAKPKAGRHGGLHGRHVSRDANR